MGIKVSSFYLIILSLFFLINGCGKDEHSLEVDATAFNSTKAQTDGNPSLTAWGDKLKHGVKAIAVSRDLLKLGLTHGVDVKIDGLPGTYKVLDKMNKKWKKKIDIYMGTDTKAARKWGKRKVVIHWSEKK